MDVYDLQVQYLSIIFQKIRFFHVNKKDKTGVSSNH